VIAALLLSLTLDAQLQAIVDDPQKPLASLSVVAIRHGKVVYRRHFGPGNEETLYRIASITKLVVAVGVMKLVEAGKLDLDADIERYLGDRVRNPAFPGTPITLRMLLTHTSSLRDDAGYVFGAGHDMRAFLTQGGKMWATVAPPGEYFAYCNLNFGVVGTVMEKAAGERFDRLMQRLVLDPLGMRGGFNPAEMPADRVSQIAPIYRKATAGDVQTWDPAGPWVAQVDDYSKAPPANRGSDYVLGTNGALFGPQGNLRASADDLARVMLMLMNGGTIDGKRYLEKRTVDAMLARVWKFQGDNGDTSFGARKDSFQAWGVGNQHFVDVSGPGSGDRLVDGGGFRAVGHTGNAYGLHGAVVFDPRERDGIIYLAGGTGFDPETDRGRYSSLNRYEERILTAVYRSALQGRAN
jgi:CubicO group peptidase (beta-lactamase class C family)